ncbi:uncharacterized protein B0H64DRAFT_325897 [Chaetomium fimeti]|uniref:Zn(2)-C6 fungal-type domain-containing protein n=1 Tax=Chaetomium fimeti TaxID=1854472 RepID=A0AAE0HCU0_9PEZI|nr:hypothetical protein B0H64DRAFT_325897 [Chaetomium fimeti]
MSASRSPIRSQDRPRRSHRKSRLGCAECKRRRVKCDETRPVCKRCALAGRQCAFSLMAPSLPSTDASSVISGSDAQDSTAETWTGPADVSQAQLLYHFTSSHGLIPMFRAPEELRGFTADAMVKEGLTCPFLLNQILAFSARHLASCRNQPEEKTEYLRQAKSYQTHGIMLFTATPIDIDKDNYLPLLFFTCLLGIHQLCDVNLGENKNNILEHFLEYLDVSRGLRTVTTQAWDVMHQTEWRELLTIGSARAELTGIGTQTAALRTLISESLGLDEPQKADCDEAASKIQAAFDLGEAGLSVDVLQLCFHHLLSWPQIIKPGFISAARAKRPEALIIVAHFCVLLHWCRNLWIIGPMARDLFHGVQSCLGAGWEKWLQWPQSVFEGS